MLFLMMLMLIPADQFQVDVQTQSAPEFVVDVATDKPDIEFQQAPKAAAPQAFFALYFAQHCGPCDRMKADGVVAALESAGHGVVVVDITEDPQPTVTAAPEVWLCDANRKPIRKWKGYTTAKELLTKTTVEGLCKLSAGGSKWSGVSIGDGLVLTVAHHDKTEGFVVEFPLQFGGTQYIKLDAELIKTDADSDLSVLRFRAPDLVEVKSHAICSLPASAIEIPGYLSGETPKRVRIRKKNIVSRVAGILIDSYDGDGIISPQVGMSGSPLLTPEKQIAGIQAIGKGSEIGAVTVDTIREFLNDVDREEKPPVVAAISGAQLNPQTIAAALAVHLHQNQGLTPPAFGSLFDITVDAPDSARGWIADMLSKQSVDFPSSGFAISWKGGDRTISVAPGRIQITPGATVSVQKFGVSLSTTLRSVTHADDLNWITLELDGAPDLTVRFE